MYAAGISVWGLFYAAYAGTYDSAIYDVVLEETGSAEVFARCYGRLQMFEATAFITSAALSALVARCSLRLEYLIGMNHSIRAAAGKKMASRNGA
jgi:hypothetical protein